MPQPQQKTEDGKKRETNMKSVFKRKRDDVKNDFPKSNNGPIQSSVTSDVSKTISGPISHARGANLFSNNDIAIDDGQNDGEAGPRDISHQLLYSQTPFMEQVELAARLSAFDSFLFLANDDISLQLPEASTTERNGKRRRTNDENGGESNLTVEPSNEEDLAAENKEGKPTSEKQELERPKQSQSAPTGKDCDDKSDAANEKTDSQRVLQQLIRNQEMMRQLPVLRVVPGTSGMARSGSFQSSKEVGVDIINSVKQHPTNILSNMAEDSTNSLRSKSDFPNDTTETHTSNEEFKTCSVNSSITPNHNSIIMNSNNPSVRIVPWEEMIVRTVPGSIQEHQELSQRLSAFDEFMFLVDGLGGT